MFYFKVTTILDALDENPNYRPTISGVISGFNVSSYEINQIIKKYEENNAQDGKSDNEQWLWAGTIWLWKLCIKFNYKNILFFKLIFSVPLSILFYNNFFWSYTINEIIETFFLVYIAFAWLSFTFSLFQLFCLVHSLTVLFNFNYKQIQNSKHFFISRFFLVKKSLHLVCSELNKLYCFICIFLLL